MPNYDRFELRLDGGQVAVMEPAGRGVVASHALDLPLDDPDFAEALRLLRFEPEGDTEQERAKSLRQMATEVEARGGFRAIARFVGETLFHALLPEGSQARSQYGSSLDGATRAGRGLQIILSIAPVSDADEQSLLSLPWEYLYDPVRGLPLACSGRTVMARGIAPAQAVRPFACALPMRVLAAICEPHDADPFGAERAWQSVTEGLEPGCSGVTVALRRLPHPTFDSLLAEVDAWKPDVLHFVGHGNFYDGPGGVLLFEDPYGAKDVVGARRLQEVLGASGLSLACLISCRSGETGAGNDFAGVTQALVKGGIPAVVSMQFSMYVDSANVFIPAFYSALARTR